MDTDGVGDSNYPGGDTYRLGSSGYVDAAYVNYESGWGYASFGKAPAMWGPGRQGNLLISENAPSVVRIAAQVRLRWLHFAAFSGELQPGRDGDGVKANRFLAGHRLVMTPFSWLEIGFAEVVLYGGSGAGISYRRSNPLTWFFAEEVNTNRYGEDTNGLASADVTVRPVPGAEAYVSVLIDDVSLDGKSPHRVGGTAGARWEAPFGWDRAGLGAEYTMVTRWMYNNGNSVPHMRYSNGSAALGHYLGPDGDALFLEGYWENAGGYRASCALTHRRRGETRFDSRYPVDAQGANFGYSCDPFPFGTVDSRTAGEIAIEAPPMRGAVVTLGFRATRTENADNARHDPEWGIGFRADLDWHLPLRY